MSVAKPSVIVVAAAAFAMMSAAKPSVTEVIEEAFAMMSAAKPSVIDVILVAFARMVAESAAEESAIAVATGAETFSPKSSTDSLLVSVASFCVARAFSIRCSSLSKYFSLAFVVSVVLPFFIKTGLACLL